MYTVLRHNTHAVVVTLSKTESLTTATKCLYGQLGYVYHINRSEYVFTRGVSLCDGDGTSLVASISNVEPSVWAELIPCQSEMSNMSNSSKEAQGHTHTQGQFGF